MASDPLSDVPTESTPIRNPSIASSESPPRVRRPTYNISDLPDIPKPKKKIVSTFFGTTRTLSTITYLEWFYLSISILSLIASVGISLDRIIELRQKASSGCPATKGAEAKSDLTFAVLLLWTSLWSLYHVIVGVTSERPYDLFVYMVTTAVVWVYVVINFIQTPDPKPPVKLGRLVAVCVFGPPILYFGFKLAKKYFVSNNMIFNTVGANLDMQKMCRTLFICDSLLKFDVQLGGSALILWVQKSFVDPSIDLREMVVIGVGAVVTVFWAGLGYLAIRLENDILVYTFFATSFFEPAIIIYNFIRSSGMECVIESLLYSTIACGIIAILSRFATLYSMFRVQKNFGKGLKDKIFKAVAANPEQQGTQGKPRILLPPLDSTEPN